MARYNFGGDLASFTILAPSGQSNVVKSQPNATGSVYAARTGGSALTDLLDANGAATSSVTSDTNGFIDRFQGPNGYTDLWVDFGGGSRLHVRSVDGALRITDANTKIINDKLSFGSHADRGGDAPTYSTVTGEHTANGQLRIFSQLSTQFHDLVLAPGSAHADLHLSRLAASYRSQLVTITGSPTGGTFTLTYGGQTTSALAYNAAPATIQSALQALSTLADHRVYIYSATGGTAVVGGPWTISVTDPDATALTATSSLTGGSSPTVTVAQSTPDGAMYIDIPINGTIPFAGTLLGQRSTGQLEMQLGGSGGTFRWLSSAGALLMSVNNSGILTLGTVTFSGNSDLPRFYGGGSTGGLAIHGAAASAGTGTNGLIRFRDNDTDNNTRFQIDTAAPPSGRTAMAVQYHNGTTTAFQYATVGAADSGGVGFRVLRVPN